MSRANTSTAWAMAALSLLGCGSRGPIFDDPFRGRDGGRGPDAPSLDAPSLDVPAPDAAPPCDWTPFSEGLSGGGLGALVVDPAVPSRRAIVGVSGRSVYRTEDGGATWTRRGEVPAEVRALAFADRGLLASSAEGLFLSEDGGVSFEAFALDGLAMGALTMHPDGTRGYASVGGLGVVRTNDGGRTWSPATLGLEDVIIDRLTVDPRDPDVVIATTVSIDPVTRSATADGWIARSVDGGARWQRIEERGGRSYDLRRCAGDPAVVLAVRRYGMFLSKDGGASFDTLPVVGEQVFTSAEVGGAGCERITAFSGYPAAGFGIYVGDPATPLEGPFVSGFEMSRAARSSPEIVGVDVARTVVATVSGPFLSDDGARTFRSIEGFLSMPVTALAETEGALWLGTYGSGLWSLGPSETEWRRVSAADLANDYTFGLLPLDGATLERGDVIVGLYGSLVARRDGSSRFELVPNEGSPADNMFDFTRLADGTILAASQTEGIQRSDDGGRTFRFSNEGFVPWSTPLGVLNDMRAIASDPSRPGLVIAGGVGGGVWRSEDGGRRWAASGLDGEDVRPIVLAPRRGRFVAAVQGDGVFESEDGTAWTAIIEGLGSLDVDGLTADADDTLYATAGGVTYVREPGAARWREVGGVCAPTSARFPRVVERADGRWLVVVDGGDGLSRRRL